MSQKSKWGHGERLNGDGSEQPVECYSRVSVAQHFDQTCACVCVCDTTALLHHSETSSVLLASFSPHEKIALKPQDES